jgi:hypothetical protein
MQATGKRRPARVRPPLTGGLDPRRDRIRVGPGLAAQTRGLVPARLVQLSLGGSELEARNLGQQVGPAACELAQLGHRGGFLGFGRLAPPDVTPGGTGYPGDEDTATLWPFIDHARSRMPALYSGRTSVAQGPFPSLRASPAWPLAPGR